MFFKELENLAGKYLIIDSHLHLGRMSYLYMPSNTEENIINLLKKFGVKKAICANHGMLSTINYGLGELFEALQRNEDFLYGYLVFNPMQKACRQIICFNHKQGFVVFCYQEINFLFVFIPEIIKCKISPAIIFPHLNSLK